MPGSCSTQNQHTGGPRKHHLQPPEPQGKCPCVLQVDHFVKSQHMLHSTETVFLKTITKEVYSFEQF